MNAPPVMNGGETNKAKEDEKVKAVLVLEDGTRYEGYSFGAMSNTGSYLERSIFFLLSLNLPVNCQKQP